MTPKSRETPRERYASSPLTEQERHDLPIKFKTAVAMGEPVVINGARGDTLEFRALGCSINEGGDIHLTFVCHGSVERGGRTVTAKGTTQHIVVPAKEG